jgi:predicted nucleic acid-binding protein
MDGVSIEKRRMSVRNFLDTNVLVYTDDHSNPAKQEVALDLIGECRATNRGVVSLQVLQEYFNVATRKLGVDAAVAKGKVELFAELHLVIPGLDDVLAAIDLQRLHKFSFWDAMIVRSAVRGLCKRLYSEDMQHGRRIEGIEIVNPFA